MPPDLDDVCYSRKNQCETQEYMKLTVILPNVAVSNFGFTSAVQSSVGICSIFKDEIAELYKILDVNCQIFLFILKELF